MLWCVAGRAWGRGQRRGRGEGQCLERELVRLVVVSGVPVAVLAAVDDGLVVLLDVVLAAAVVHAAATRRVGVGRHEGHDVAVDEEDDDDEEHAQTRREDAHRHDRHVCAAHEPHARYG